MEQFAAGDKVQLMENGVWSIRIYEVTDNVGRTPDHLVLRTANGNLFELYNDAPYNVRLAYNIWGTLKSDIDPKEYCVDCERDTREGHYSNCPTK